MKPISRRQFVALAVASGASLVMAGCSGTSASPSSSSKDASSAASDSSASTSASAEAPSSAAGKTLVLCFSATGNTRAVAKTLVDEIGADYLEIEPEQPYTAEDLDYSDTSTRATVEQNEGTARPAIATQMPDWSTYNIVLVGHPIWWGKVPRIVCTLFEDNGRELAEKKVADFCTSGSSGISEAANELRSIVPDATWGEGRRFETGASAAEVGSWARGLGFGIA